MRFFLLCFLCQYVAYPQTVPLRLDLLTIPDAPPLATIDCFYEDSRGFMWFGTYSGLYRFDGYALEHFTQNPNDSLSIGDNKIRSILEDKQGNFWVGTQVGLHYFDLRKKTFRRYTDKQRYGIGNIEIHDLKQDRYGVVWVAASDGLYRFNKEKNFFEKCFPKEASAVSSVIGVGAQETGIYFCSRQGLFFADFDGKKVDLMDSNRAVFQIFFDDLCMLQDAAGTIWIGGRRGLFYFAPGKKTGILEHPAFKNTHIGFLCASNKADEIWIASGGTLSVLNTQTGQCTKNIPLQIGGEDPDMGQFFQGFHASFGIFWLSTTSKQLYQLAPRKQRFRHIPVDLVKELPSVSQLFEMYLYSPDELLVPHKNGPLLLNIHGQQTRPFQYVPKDNITGWKEGVICFWEDPGGFLWIGTGGGLFLFDKNRRCFVRLAARGQYFSTLDSEIVRKIHRDKKGNLWIATWNNGIFKINETYQTISHYNHSEVQKALNIAHTRSILETQNGDIWVGTRGGLLKYMETGDSFLVYRNIPNNLESMSENTAFCIYEDKYGDIWCGTYGGGLNKLDVKAGKFAHFTTENGLLNNNVFSLLPDRQENLWLMGYNGISRFNPSTRTFDVFTHWQGLLNKEYDAFLYGKSPYSNLLFFAGNKGIDFFDPDSIQLSRHDPEVWLTGFKLQNKSVPIARNSNWSDTFSLAEDIAFTKHLTLRHDQNVITFEYAALDYSSPQTIEYQYQLTGFDTAWQQVGHRRSATYTNLDPGAYTFRVRATNGDGVWGSKEAAINITVLTPWWRSWWFRGLVFLTLATLVAAFYQYRIRQIREKEAIRANLNQRIVEVKMEALRSQMNPHFIFNCLSSLKSYSENNEPEKASLHISKFAKLLRQILEQSTSDVIPLEIELETLQHYVELEQMRYKNFDFAMIINPDVLERNIKIPPLMVQPCLENAIWHGLQYKKTGRGHLRLQVVVQGGECQITVEDNGIGRAASQALKAHNRNAHISHGINITEERVALFAQKYGNNARIAIMDLTDDEGNAAGTRVVLAFKTME